MGKERRVLDRKVLFPGDILIREGDYGDCAFFVQSGQMGVYKQSGGEEVLITVLPGNCIVGEMALIDNSPRSATVRCLETATVVQVTRTVFEKKLSQLDPFLVALLEMLVQKIRRLNAGFTETETKLLTLKRQVGIPHPPRERTKGGDTVSKGRTTVTPAQPVVSHVPISSSMAPPSLIPLAGSALSEAPPAPARPTLPGIPASVDPAKLSRFDRAKLELALLYHPECTRDRFTETQSRAETFREVWNVLTKIEREIPADQLSPTTGMENNAKSR